MNGEMLSRRLPIVPTNAGTLVLGLRRRFAMTQEHFAREIDVTVSTINRWERGQSRPSRLAWPLVVALAKARGVPGW